MSPSLPSLPTPIVPPDADPGARSKLARFDAWLAEVRRPWWRPDLDAYRDALLASGLAASTVSYYVSAVRVRYGQIVKDRDLLWAMTPSDADTLRRKALVDELVTRLLNATDQQSGRVEQIERQDVGDHEHTWLTEKQARRLLAACDADTLLGARDAAMFALLMCTGVRSAELVALRVADLYRKLGGTPALHVREGKGGKARLVPYGSLVWCLEYVARWREVAQVERGRLWGVSLTTRAVALRLDPYRALPGCKRLRLHDFRRTYARWLYDMGVPIDGIRANLGHEDVEVTWGYVGPVKIEDRIPGGRE